MSGTSRFVVLVDGSNVARSDAWERVTRREQGEVPHADHRLDTDPRARLLDWILAWTTHSGADIVAVFDGKGPLGAGRRQFNHSYLVIGTGAVDGDRVIEQEAVRLHDAGVRFRLVTNDHALANVAGAHAEVVHDVEHFVAEITAEPVSDPAGEQGDDTLDRAFGAGSRLVDSVDDDVLARLERMRRGE